jgi:hypothetical protein
MATFADYKVLVPGRLQPFGGQANFPYRVPDSTGAVQLAFLEVELLGIVDIVGNTTFMNLNVTFNGASQPQTAVTIHRQTEPNVMVADRQIIIIPPDITQLSSVNFSIQVPTNPAANFFFLGPMIMFFRPA